MGSVYRYRTCKKCGSEFPAGELRPLRYGAGHWHSRGGSLRECPRCGYIGFTQDFPITRDDRAGIPAVDPEHVD